MNQRRSMAPSVDKQTPTKMVLASEEKPMEICANVTETVAVFPRNYAHEFYQKTTASHQLTTFAYNHTHTDQRSPHDSYERLDHVACCYLVSQLGMFLVSCIFIKNLSYFMRLFFFSRFSFLLLQKFLPDIFFTVIFFSA